MLRLFDTAAGAVRPFEPRVPGQVSMYVCGPTVYGPPHLGHGRFSLVFDVLRRYFEWSGLEVTYVSNITDIDDKIIERANSEGRPWQEITEKCEAVWYRAMDAIGVKRPTHDPHATAYVTQMVDLISRLIEKGAAYETSDGVYFRPRQVADYGLLARQDIDSLQVGARVDVVDEKETPIDFALWKKAKPGEPSWPSPWGDGRPGWHTECVVMSLDLLGEGFDLHGGGQDLCFPHHENERAQAVADGKDFAHHWVHNGFVEVGGEKMSKSLGNFTNLLDLIDRYDPRAYRLLCLQAHYRSPIDVNEKNSAQASAALERYDALARRVTDLGHGVAPDPVIIGRFRDRMDDDLNTGGALAIVAETVTQINRSLDIDDFAGAEPLVAAFRSMLSAVGLTVNDEVAAVADEAADLCRQRDDARAAKEWGRADALRGELEAMGYVVEDTATGTQVRRA
ncbi:MAG TPA: cysteine--tRNA ligase [Microthrixaceae bacterium]|jgi:cysteinyl-tRNA synthetase|nr:cysteine--tRNA ligase [Microthrixaceae bacterium]HQF95416.1 cysteine--tRNA ligase [Microthrixaceae bacterium]